MKHSNISVFVPHIGCPNKCAFCNQHTISGRTTPPTADDVRRICSQAVSQIKNPGNCEVAFFGGSFTAIERDYMISLLEAASGFVGENKFSGVRISTRPDAIDSEILTVLKKYNVTSVELGAQSMCDAVLKLNDRGHTADDVRKSSRLIKSFGFSLGLQMMTGLYGSDIHKDRITANEILKLLPDTVRIYPTVILKHTKLAELFERGIYQPYPFDDCVKLCAELCELFENNNVRVIKLGLHASEAVERDMVGGYYHPAFRELCEGEIFKRQVSKLILNDENSVYKSFTVSVNKRDLSKAKGQKKSNIRYFEELGINLEIVPSEDENVRILEKK